MLRFYFIFLFSLLLSAFLAYAGVFFEIEGFLNKYKGYITGVHILGVTLGFGSAIITDILFMKFLKDQKVSRQEESVLETLSKIVWPSVGVLIISGVLLVIANPLLLLSSKFQIKLTVVCVIILNGFFLNTIVSPRLIKIPFGQLSEKTKKIRNIRRLSFALGSISMVSWCVAFLLGILDTLPFSYFYLLGLYAALLLVATLTSQLVEFFISKGYLKNI